MNTLKSGGTLFLAHEVYMGRANAPSFCLKSGTLTPKQISQAPPKKTFRYNLLSNNLLSAILPLHPIPHSFGPRQPSFLFFSCHTVPRGSSKGTLGCCLFFKIALNFKHIHSCASFTITSRITLEFMVIGIGKSTPRICLFRGKMMN